MKKDEFESLSIFEQATITPDYQQGFQAGAASRDAEIAELVAALNDVRAMIGHPDNIAIIDAALAKVRKL